MIMEDITVQELRRRMDEGTTPPLIDVREPWEFEQDCLEAKNIPLATIPSHLETLEPLMDDEIVVYCRSGGRSGQAKMFLMALGFKKVRNLTGGMLEWKEQIAPDFNV